MTICRTSAQLFAPEIEGHTIRALISVFLMPALYALVARPHDKLEV